MPGHIFGVLRSRAPRPDSHMADVDPEPRQSLSQVAPTASAFLFAAACSSSGVIGAFFGEFHHPDPTMTGVATFFVVVHTASLLVYILHPCIKQRPGTPGKTIFCYYLMWVATQAFGFVAVDSLWDNAWPDALKRLGVAWMLLSLVTIALWTSALIVVLTGRGGRQQQQQWPLQHDVELAPPRYRSEDSLREYALSRARERTMVTTQAPEPARTAEGENKGNSEHVECREPPPAYVPRGERGESSSSSA